MINYIDHHDGIKLLTQLMVDERLVPIFGAGFTKNSNSFRNYVPDGEKSTILMQNLLTKYVPHISKEVLLSYDFNDTAKRLRKSVPNFVPEQEYIDFLRYHFTNVTLAKNKVEFLKLPWPYAYTINVDDGIENTKLFTSILPYQKARIKSSVSRPLYKLHGDASYEINYAPDENIIFDSDQYTQSLISENNQTMRENFTNSYREFNLLFVGCSLKNEPDIRYIYNNIKKEKGGIKTSRIILRTEKLTQIEESDLEDYGITHIILVKDYDVFYIDFVNSISNQKIQEKLAKYEFTNPTIKLVHDRDLKYFSGYRSFDEEENTFYKSDLVIDRKCLDDIEMSLKSFNLIFIEGRRFAGKSSLLCTICEKERSRTVYYFPSTTLESIDVVINIINNSNNSLLLFDSNSLSVDGYYLLQDVEDILKKNNNKIIVVFNQSDNFLSEITNSGYIIIKNKFDEDEITLLTPKTNSHALTERHLEETNLDYLNTIKKEQKIHLALNMNLPLKYTNNEQILLLLLCVKDKIYSREINSLRIKNFEIESFVNRVSILAEWIKTSKGESNTYSSFKLVHNSKSILMDEMQKISNDDIVSTIKKIVSTFKNGDDNQKRIYREVMQFDTLNMLFGRKKGAGYLIFKVYENLESLLEDDLHFWLQRSKSIYRLAPTKYWKLKTAYSYAKKVYLDSKKEILTTKASLTISLICSLLYPLEKNKRLKQDFQEEAINLGYSAIFSDYYKYEKRLHNDLSIENIRKNYVDLILNVCHSYILATHSNPTISRKAQKIISKLQ